MEKLLRSELRRWAGKIASNEIDALRTLKAYDGKKITIIDDCKDCLPYSKETIANLKKELGFLYIRTIPTRGTN